MFRPAFALFAQQYLKALLTDYGVVYLNEPIPRDPKLRVFKHPSRFNWGTEYLRALTAGNARVMISPEVVAEAELVDVLFEPKVKKSRKHLGLLGKLVSSPCIIEIMRWVPDAWDLRTCLRHYLTWEAETDGSIIPVDENSPDTDEERKILPKKGKKTLLIIVPSITPQNMKGTGAEKSSSQIPGIYKFPPAFHTTVVVTSELPQDTSTLWLRILGRGRTQTSAIMDLMQLDVNHPHSAEVKQQLQQWYQLLSDGRMGKESNQLMQTLAIVDGLS